LARELLQKWLEVRAVPEFKDRCRLKRHHNMRGDKIQAENEYGQLMACLMSERDRFATESDFLAFALESVRRFIVDVRALDIELTMRPRYLSDPPTHSSHPGPSGRG
jgi:hypothetical protein